MTDLGSSMGGGGLSSKGLSEGVKKSVSDFYDKNIEKPFKDQAKKLGTAIAKKTIGYKTEEEEKKEEADNKAVRSGINKANKEADKAVDKYKKEHGAELLDKSVEERNKILSKVRADASKSSVESNKEMQSALKSLGKTTEDALKAKGSDFTTSDSLGGLIGNKVFKGNFNNKSIDSKNKKLEKKGKYGTFGLGNSNFSDREIKGVVNSEKDSEMSKLKDAKLSKSERTEQENKIKDNAKNKFDELKNKNARFKMLDKFTKDSKKEAIALNKDRKSDFKKEAKKESKEDMKKITENGDRPNWVARGLSVFGLDKAAQSVSGKDVSKWKEAGNVKKATKNKMQNAVDNSAKNIFEAKMQQQEAVAGNKNAQLKGEGDKVGQLKGQGDEAKENVQGLKEERKPVAEVGQRLNNEEQKTQNDMPVVDNQGLNGEKVEQQEEKQDEVKQQEVKQDEEKQDEVKQGEQDEAKKQGE